MIAAHILPQCRSLSVVLSNKDSLLHFTGIITAVKHVVAYGGFVSKTTLPFICMLNYYANSVSKLLKLTTPPFWSIFRTLPPILSEHLSFKVSRILKKKLNIHFEFKLENLTVSIITASHKSCEL